MLVAHDESTVQAHDRKKASWIKMENSQSERRVLVGAFTKATSFA